VPRGLRQAQAVRIVRDSGKAVGTVARELDLTETALRSWVRQAEIEREPHGFSFAKKGAAFLELLRECPSLAFGHDTLLPHFRASGVSNKPGQVHTTGTSNTAVGVSALSTNTIGAGNIVNDVGVLFGNTTGSNNTASGGDALSNNTTGNLNTATGLQALNSNVSGLENTAIGVKALKKSLRTKNIGIGYQAGVTLQTGNDNIYIGQPRCG